MILANINHRTLGAALVWLSNIVALCVHVLTFNVIPLYQSKLIYAYSCFFTLVYFVWQLLKGFGTPVHKGFMILTLASLSIFFIFIILQFQFDITSYKAKIGVFLLTEIITLTCIIISGLKLGLFKNEKRNLL